MDKFAQLTDDKLEEVKKKAMTHCLNLECKKEQLQILIKKLSTISGQRLDLLYKSQGIKESSNCFGLRKSSISDELRFAEDSREIVEVEIKNAKYQLKVIENIMLKRK
ncbi:MAG: hypothetical protein WCG23_08480 [bacterium]